MVSGPITSWQIDGGKVEIVTNLIFLGSKITGDGDAAIKLKDACSLEQSFSSSHVQTRELDHKEGWAPENWYFGTVLLEKTLESPWTARRSNESILKEINPEYSLEGLMLKLKLRYSGHLMWRADSLEKTLILGKMKTKEGRGRGWDV